MQAAATAPFGLAPARRAARRTQEMRRAEARQRILDAAYEIVARGGFDELTLAAVGAEAGYSRALPAHYFGSREALIEEVAAEVLKGHARHLAHMAQPPGGLPTLLASIRIYLRQPLSEFEVIRKFHAFLAAANAKPMLAEAVRRIDADAVGRIAELVRQGQARAEIRADVDPQVEARIILGALRGLVTQHLHDVDAFPLEATTGRFIDQVRETLRTD